MMQPNDLYDLIWVVRKDVEDGNTKSALGFLDLLKERVEYSFDQPRLIKVVQVVRRWLGNARVVAQYSVQYDAYIYTLSHYKSPNQNRPCMISACVSVHDWLVTPETIAEALLDELPSEPNPSGVECPMIVVSSSDN